MSTDGRDRQEAEALALRLEAAARSIRDALKGPVRGVHLHKAAMGYTVNVDGFDLGIDTSWSDANALCQAIATRRPPGDTSGYGVNFHREKPFGISLRDVEANTVTIGISCWKNT